MNTQTLSYERHGVVPEDLNEGMENMNIEDDDVVSDSDYSRMDLTNRGIGSYETLTAMNDVQKPRLNVCKHAVSTTTEAALPFGVLPFDQDPNDSSSSEDDNMTVPVAARVHITMMILRNVESGCVGFDLCWFGPNPRVVRENFEIWREGQDALETADVEYVTF